MRRMKLIIYVLSITLAGILLLSTVSSNAQEGQKKKIWQGNLEDGTEIGVDDFSKILKEHQKWLKTEGNEGQMADLNYAKLSNVYLCKMNREQANLLGVDQDGMSPLFSGIPMPIRVNLSNAKLIGADLSKALLYFVGLSGADLRGANLSNAKLIGADMSGANLTGSDLRGADLTGANLSKTMLVDANLKDANFSKVNCKEAQYEPSSSPHKGSLGGIKGLKMVKFEKGQQSGLVQLRSALKDAGLRDLEREATYAIEHWKTNYATWYKKWPKLLLFEWTCGYGLYSLRPLLILSGLFVVFAIVYIFPIVSKSKSGIYKIWPMGRSTEEKASERLDKLLGVQLIGYAFYFSILSTFHIGWRDLNVGSWIARVQPNEYFLKASGWVRTVSGVQSLISIYLLALWVLTQFGRPFE